MLTQHNVSQILEEHEASVREPDLVRQEPIAMIYSTALARASELQRSPRIEDAIFAAWAFAIPIFPQDDDYADFMRNVRRELFQDQSVTDVEQRARDFFQPDFLSLHLHDLGLIVTRRGSLEQAPTGRAYQIPMYDTSMLVSTAIPALHGDTYVLELD